MGKQESPISFRQTQLFCLRWNSSKQIDQIQKQSYPIYNIYMSSDSGDDTLYNKQSKNLLTMGFGFEGWYVFWRLVSPPILELNCFPILMCIIFRKRFPIYAKYYNILPLIIMDSKQISIQDFEILSELGSGSFGKVHLVKRISDQTKYAMKSVPMNRLSQKEKQNALNEVRLLASIHIPYVISYKGSFFNPEKQSLCVIMEYADEGDLEAKINNKFKEDDQEGFEENFIWKVAFQIFQGLKMLHKNKIIHRDIKSANIFFVNGIAKLGDMNVSKVLENDMCSTQTGTPYYTSPQIWKGQKYNRKCDIWSTGCLLYELCTLKPPFRAKDFPSLYRKVLVGNYQPIPGNYSNQLNDLIRMCLTVDDDFRPDASDLLQTSILRGMELSLQKFRIEESSITLIDPIKCPRVLRFLNNKLPQAKFGERAKKTVGFATKKQIQFDEESFETEKKLKFFKKVKSQKLIMFDDEKSISKKNISNGSKKKIKLPPLDKEEEPLRFSSKKTKQGSEKKIGSRKVIVICEKENSKIE